MSGKTVLYLVKSDVAEGATNTARPLTPTLELARKGLAMDASRPTKAHWRRLRWPVSPWQLEFDYAVEPERPAPQKRSQRLNGACMPFDGGETKWRAKATQLCWINLGVERAALAWPTPVCKTPLCLNLDHLAWESPKRLEYAPGICVYCGVIAGTMDHLLPRTWTGEAARRNVLTVPACGECNSAIGDRYATSITRRRKIAHAYVACKNRRVLNMPAWPREDVRKLGPTLRSSVEKGIHERKLARARLSWPEDADYDLRAMQLSGIENPYELGLITRPEEMADEAEATARRNALSPCGTVAAYRRHRAKREVPCLPCRRAEKERIRVRDAERQKGTA